MQGIHELEISNLKDQNRLETLIVKVGAASADTGAHNMANKQGEKYDKLMEALDRAIAEY